MFVFTQKANIDRRLQLDSPFSSDPDSQDPAAGIKARTHQLLVLGLHPYDAPNPYRTVRRATPATLTGVSGRPTMASAVETKLCIPGIESCSPSSSAKSDKVAATKKMPICFDKVIWNLLS